ncbi:MAG TPA: YciI family protein [Sporichthya sp.]|jgi:hypothetical protein|nr:YciI family protein [Sporichthya sp.]
MTQYMLSVIHDPDQAMPEGDDLMQLFADVDAVNQDIKAAGQWVFGGGLEHPNSATVVNSAGGKVTVTDGPYVETKEQLGGFWVVELPDLDAALKLAERASAACRNAIEVRPFQPEPEI